MAEINFTENKFCGALALESFAPQRVRRLVVQALFFALFVFVVLAVVLPFVAPSINTRRLDGLIPLFSAILLMFLALNAFWNSKTRDLRGNAGDTNLARRFDFYVSELWWRGPRFSRTASTQLLFEALLRTTIGRAFLARIGIDRATYKEFLITSTVPWIPLPALAESLAAHAADGREITLPVFLRTLFEGNFATKAFLDSHDIPLQAVEGAGRWLDREFSEADTARRWWLWEHLARVPGIGKQWSYGETPVLQQFADDMAYEALRASGSDLVGKDREIRLIESALLKSSGANVVLVGEIGSGRHAVLLGLVSMIETGVIFPDLEDKHVFHLQSSVLSATGKTKSDIESLLIQLLNEAVRAGNIILVVDDFPEFVDSLAKSGVNAADILTPYLAHPAIHLFAIADPLGFRRTIENDAALMKYFERIDITEPEGAALIEILEEHVPAAEGAHQRIVLTYQAVEAVASGATEHLVAGALPKRAIDLMDEVAGAAAAAGTVYVLPELVKNFISQKTKMPMGTIGKDEQNKLMHLEAFLRERVIGQDEAVAAIADAIRRARSGINDPKRPIGTFLFMGPTGVGKTETAKALAESYFGSEENMLRFDMTEYQEADAFDKLVGSFEKNEPGLLTSRLQASPYALVLLDEFEKSSPKIRNLFLQILDEGFFTDYLGHKVNMRNTIIIATSNAGANLIWDAVNKGIDPASFKKDIFAAIQTAGLYSPELLNRFDEVVIFHPLGPDILAMIARVHLDDLAARLAASKNITLLISDPLVEAVAKAGYDPAFGARPMQRVIQDRVEKLVANKIIQGAATSGGTVTFSPGDIASIE